MAREGNFHSRARTHAHTHTHTQLHTRSLSLSLSLSLSTSPTSTAVQVPSDVLAGVKERLRALRLKLWLLPYTDANGGAHIPASVVDDFASHLQKRSFVAVCLSLCLCVSVCLFVSLSLSLYLSLSHTPPAPHNSHTAAPAPKLLDVHSTWRCGCRT